MIIAFCVVGCILGVTVAKAFAHHRRDITALQQRVSGFEHRHNMQSVRVAECESAVRTIIKESESANE